MNKNVSRIMLGLVGLLLSLWTSFAGSDLPSGDLVQMRNKKLQEPFLKKADWITDYDKALGESKQSGKLILAFFTRSYAH